MSATEWKFVPVEPTEEMLREIHLVESFTGRALIARYTAMLAAAPVPPSVESLLENWTPSDQKAFAKFRDEHFPGEMSSYAIQSLGSAWKYGRASAALSVWYGSMPESNGKTNWTAILHRKGECMSEGITIDRSEYPERVRYEADRMRHLIGELEQEPDVLAYDGDKHSGYGKPAHLTIPGALEWDGDNGTHGVVGTHSADGVHSESVAAIATLKALGYTHNGGTHWKPPVGQKLDFDLIDSLRVQLDNTEQSRRSFFDLSQDLEKRLAAAEQRKAELIKLLNGYPRGVPGFAAWADKVTAAIKPAGTGASVAKVCIECDQPYCHGVCVERGDQDYDRDQAAKGGDDE